VPGLSETITVRSLVGRYLEHSRIFSFGGVADRPRRISFGSPDLMERNLDRRVEVIVPVDDPEIQLRLSELLEAALRDQANSWTLHSDGSWNRWQPSTERMDWGSTSRISAKSRLSNPTGPGSVRPRPCRRANGDTDTGVDGRSEDARRGSSGGTGVRVGDDGRKRNFDEPDGDRDDGRRRRWPPAWMRRRR